MHKLGSLSFTHLLELVKLNESEIVPGQMGVNWRWREEGVRNLILINSLVQLLYQILVLDLSCCSNFASHQIVLLQIILTAGSHRS